VKNDLLEAKLARLFGAKGAAEVRVSKALKDSGANIYMRDINIKGITEEPELEEIRNWIH